MAEEKKVIETKMPEWAERLIEENKKMAEKIKMFEELAGKNTIASYEEGKETHTPNTCYFKKFKGKLVVGWSELDLSHFNPRALDAIGENIFMEIIYDDGEKEKINYMEFVRCSTREKCILIKTGSEISTVQFPDGHTVEIPSKFINA